MISATTALLLGGAALLIFGPKRLPEVARSLGRSVSEFKAGADEARETFRQASKQAGEPPSTEAPEPVSGASESTSRIVPPVGDGEPRPGS